MSAPLGQLGRLADEIDRSLRELGTPERAAQAKAYLKSSMTHFGTSVPDCRAVVRAFVRGHPDVRGVTLRALAAELWREPVFEHRLAAALLLRIDAAAASRDDFALVEGFIRDSHTWALVDTLACDVAGDLVERFPESANILDRWAADDDFLARRSALLALLLPLRRGEGDWDHFTRLAEPMLGEQEFFIRKALGWVLRETAKRRPALVEAWLRPRASAVSRLTLREAIKPLPAPVAQELLLAAGGRTRADRSRVPGR